MVPHPTHPSPTPHLLSFFSVSATIHWFYGTIVGKLNGIGAANTNNDVDALANNAVCLLQGLSLYPTTRTKPPLELC
jgi:hypothetical protein